MLIGASFLFGSQFMVTKAFEKNYGKTVRASLSFSLLYSLFAGVIFFIIKLVSSGTVFNLNPFSLCMAFGLSLVNILSSAIGIKTLALGDIAVYSLFLMLGGMIVPFFAGIVFLKESVSGCNLIGVAIMIIALCLPVFSAKRIKTPEKRKPTATQRKRLPYFFTFCACFCLFLTDSVPRSRNSIPSEKARRSARNSLFTLTEFSS